MQNWIRSKKKVATPVINVGRYGPMFTAWWKKLQPLWRVQGDGTFGQNAPVEEDWQALRKGGTTGIYTVVIALSWWINAQGDEHDIALWDIVNDISWVIQQLRNQDSQLEGSSVPMKRAHEDGSADEEQPKLRKR